MSRFLAPIHTWLFNKIKLSEGLESNLVENFKEKYGEELETIYKQIQNKHGYPIEDRPIEELIDVSNIHGWLQNKISIAETRQAALLSELSNKHGQEVKDIAINVYSEQGSECGKDAKEKYEVNGASEIYQALNNYILEGMPCDRANVITVNTEDTLQWKNEMCLHKGYWDAVSGNANLFYELRDAWIKAFVENANKNFTYNPNHSSSTFEITRN